MKISRRKFIGSSAATAAAMPMMLGLDTQAQVVADDIDWHWQGRCARLFMMKGNDKGKSKDEIA